MNTFTINQIHDNGSVDVTFSVDGKKQNISGLSVGNADKLAEELVNYMAAYESGLQVQETKKPEIDSESQAMVGKPFDMEAFMAEKQAEAEVNNPTPEVVEETPTEVPVEPVPTEETPSDGAVEVATPETPTPTE